VILSKKTTQFDIISAKRSNFACGFLVTRDWATVNPFSQNFRSFFDYCA